MKNALIGAGVVVLIILFVMFNREEAASGNIRLGALFALSGEVAAWGENAKRGVELAVEDFERDNPNMSVEVIYEDTHGDAKAALSGFMRLIQTGSVDAFIGPLLMAELASVAPLVEQYKVPMVSPAFAPLDVRPNPKNPLLLWMDPSIEVERMARGMWEDGIRSVAIISSNDPWELTGYHAFIKEFERLGGKVTERKIVGTMVADTKAETFKMVSTKPDAVFICTYYQFINTMKALSLYGYTGKTYGVEIDTYLVSETKKESESLQFVAPDFYTSDFVTSFEQKFGQKPSIPAGQAYDNTMAILELFKRHKTKDRVIEAMGDFKKWSGVSGEIEITEDNATIFPTALFEVQKGEIVRVRELK